MNLQQIKDYLAKFNGKDLNSEIPENLIRLKKIEVEKDNQEKAKDIWCVEQVYKIINHYLIAFNQLKGSEFFGAWCSLDRAEIELSFLRKHFDYSSNKYNLEFIEKNIHQYQKLFPYEYFSSRESIIKKASCSICGETIRLRNSCGHKIGEIYSGEQCFRIIEEFEFLGMAIVKNPFDKYTVLFPKDMEYNYYILEQLISNLKHPFEKWEVQTEKRIKKEYNHLGRNDKCICDSDKKYKKCCMKTGENLYDHHQISLLEQDNTSFNEIKNVQVHNWK